VNAEQALYGAFFVKEVRQRNASFLLRRVLCSISQPFLRPEPRFVYGGARRSRQGWPSHQPFRGSGHARLHLDDSEHDGTPVAIGMDDQRGACPSGADHRATTLYSVGPYVLDLEIAPRAGVLDLCGLPW
jgi:hypothetical protein